MAEMTRWKEVNETLKKNEAKIQEFIEQTELKMKELKLDIENTMREMMFESDKRMAKIKRFMENLLKTQINWGKEKVIFGGVRVPT